MMKDDIFKVDGVYTMSCQTDGGPYTPAEIELHKKREAKIKAEQEQWERDHPLITEEYEREEIFGQWFHKTHVDIIEPTAEEANKLDCSPVFISDEQLDALIAGKLLSFSDDGEYDHAIMLEREAIKHIKVVTEERTYRK